MSDLLSLSQCGRFLTLQLIENWDAEFLRLAIFQARNLQRSHGITKIQIEAEVWLNHTLSIEHILSIGEVLARLSSTQEIEDWRIAIVTEEENNQNETLQDILSLRGIELKHFQQAENALTWLLKNE